MAVTVKIKGADELFDQLNEEYVELINQAQRASAFAATAELTDTTPIDTGRARGSWYLSKSGTFLDRKEGGASAALLGPVSKKTVETLYITNGTPYIQDLNAGSSLQAPPRFVEKTIAKYFEVSGNFVKIS